MESHPKRDIPVGAILSEAEKGCQTRKNGNSAAARFVNLQDWGKVAREKRQDHQQIQQTDVPPFFKNHI